MAASSYPPLAAASPPQRERWVGHGCAHTCVCGRCTYRGSRHNHSPGRYVHRHRQAQVDGSHQETHRAPSAVGDLLKKILSFKYDIHTEKASCHKGTV